eukprot:m.30221 g.30221  ORF g.30221 m.30221 type:complete len:394 (+) comp8183_c0_seq1:219-1400(+)
MEESSRRFSASAFRETRRKGVLGSTSSAPSSSSPLMGKRPPSGRPRTNSEILPMNDRLLSKPQLRRVASQRAPSGSTTSGSARNWDWREQCFAHTIPQKDLNVTNSILEEVEEEEEPEANDDLRWRCLDGSVAETIIADMKELRETLASMPCPSSESELQLYLEFVTRTEEKLQHYGDMLEHCCDNLGSRLEDLKNREEGLSSKRSDAEESLSWVKDCPSSFEQDRSSVAYTSFRPLRKQIESQKGEIRGKDESIWQRRTELEMQLGRDGHKLKAELDGTMFLCSDKGQEIYSIEEQFNSRLSWWKTLLKSTILPLVLYVMQGPLYIIVVLHPLGKVFGKVARQLIQYGYPGYAGLAVLVWLSLWVLMRILSLLWVGLGLIWVALISVNSTTS